MIDKTEINIERAMDGVMTLEDGGFRKELIKIRALGELISYAGEDGAIAFQLRDVRTGIAYILEDIAREIEEGLDYVDKEIIDKMRPAAPRAREARNG